MNRVSLRLWIFAHRQLQLEKRILNAESKTLDEIYGLYVAGILTAGEALAVINDMWGVWE